MNIAFRSSFDRDLKQIKDRNLRDRIAEVIQRIETAAVFTDVSGVKPFGGPYFRIRVGDYRIGVRLDSDTVVFIRCLHRREIYRFFP